jgi:hypothetical protein
MIKSEGDIAASFFDAGSVTLLLVGSCVCMGIARFLWWSASTNDKRLREYNEKKRLGLTKRLHGDQSGRLK